MLHNLRPVSYDAWNLYDGCLLPVMAQIVQYVLYEFLVRSIAGIHLLVKLIEAIQIEKIQQFAYH